MTAPAKTPEQACTLARASAAALVLLTAFGAGPALAYTVKVGKFEQAAGNRPEIHVAFRNGNWRDLTSDIAEFKFSVSYTAESTVGLGIYTGYKASLTMPDQSVYADGFAEYIQQFTMTVRAAAKDLPTLGRKAVETCRKIRANGGAPTKAHEVEQFAVGDERALLRLTTERPERGVGAIKTVTKRAAYRYFIVCDKDPNYREPHRNAAVTAAALAVDVVPSADGGCPWTVKWRANFRARKSYKYYTFVLERRIEKLSPPEQTTESRQEYKVDISQPVEGGFRGRYAGEYGYPASKQQLRIVVPGTQIASSWKSIEINCGTSAKLSVLAAGLTLTRKPGPTCDAVTVLVTFTTNRPGDVPFKLHRPGGDITRTIKAEATGPGKFAATFAATQSFDKETDAAYMAETPTSFRGPFGYQSSGWKNLKVSCIKPLRGVLTLRKAGGGCRGEALVAIHTNRAGRVPYELACGQGKSWTRKADAPANRIAADKVAFAVRPGERVTCVLRTWLEGKPNNLAAASHTFRCQTARR